MQQFFEWSSKRKVAYPGGLCLEIFLSPMDPKTTLYTELWRACAGPLVTVPCEGERMFYFSQGHIEQLVVCKSQAMNLIFSPRI
ncbi:hypothetical protein CsSME_00035065 [Camellia sinensis var. sinensis]